MRDTWNSVAGLKSRVSEFTTVRLLRTWNMLRTIDSLIHASFKVLFKFTDPEIYMAGTPCARRCIEIASTLFREASEIVLVTPRRDRVYRGSRIVRNHKRDINFPEYHYRRILAGEYQKFPRHSPRCADCIEFS
jgi:hypothetical protein